MLALRFFWFRRESDKSVMVKLHGKKNIEIVGSFNGITRICKLMTGIFFHNSEIIAVSCLRNAIKFKTTHSHDS